MISNSVGVFINLTPLITLSLSPKTLGEFRGALAPLKINHPLPFNKGEGIQEIWSYIKLSNIFIARCYSAILGKTNDGRLAITRLNKYWAPIIILLVAIIVAGGIITWSRYRPSQPIEISLPPPPELPDEIYIGGAVDNPGFYPLRAEDSLEDIIQAAGSPTSSADLSRFKLYIPRIGEEQPPQKIDINRAEGWLLEALPGIGEVRAQAIVDYRRQNGRFHNINELTEVNGISIITYEQIKHLVTVTD